MTNLWSELGNVLGRADAARLREDPAALTALLGSSDLRVRGMFRELVERQLDVVAGRDEAAATYRALVKLLEEPTIGAELEALGLKDALASALITSQRDDWVSAPADRGTGREALLSLVRPWYSRLRWPARLAAVAAGFVLLAAWSLGFAGPTRLDQAARGPAAPVAAEAYETLARKLNVSVDHLMGALAETRSELGLEADDLAIEADEGFEFVGHVESMPPTGFVGVWQIGGRAVNVAAATQLDVEEGPLALGALVEVEGAARPDGSVEAYEVDVEADWGAAPRLTGYSTTQTDGSKGGGQL